MGGMQRENSWSEQRVVAVQVSWKVGAAYLRARKGAVRRAARAF